MNTFARRARRFARLSFDALFCTDGKVTPVGKENVWHIDTGRFGRAPVVLSAGVGKDISFEKELVQYYGARVLLLDPSPTGARTMQNPENQVAGVEFLPVGLAGADGTRSFAAPINPDEGSFRLGDSSAERVVFECRSLSSLAGERGLRAIDILKIDIEGFEYEVIEDLARSAIPVGQICVEFHHHMPGIPVTRTLRALRTLHRAGFRVIHKSSSDWTLACAA
jgi:FkbM family methyltransferase